MEQTQGAVLFEGTRQEHARLLSVLNELSNMLGVRQAPRMDELEMIAAFISRQFGYLTASEVGRAFELYCAGKLSYTNSNFGTIKNLQFIGCVLNAYRGYKHEQPKPQLALPEQAYVTDEERQRNMYRYLMKMMRTNRKLPIAYAWADCYEYLKSKGWLVLSDEEKENIKRKVDEKIKLEKEKIGGDALRFKNLVSLHGVKAMRRAEAVRNYLEEKIKEHHGNITDFTNAETARIDA